MSSACANSTTVDLMSPLFDSTMPLILTPKSAKNADAFLLGLINDARPDFKAFAPSDALIPPSFIAVIKNARSSTSPPSCLMTGAAFGIAIVKSSIFKTVWFSTALRKSIFSFSLSASSPKAFVKDIVVSNACSCSTPPRTASLVACATCAIKSAPIFPVAAASAAICIVFSTATPYLVNCFANNSTSFNALLVSSLVVNISP